jgi:ankyrin repeat protein
MTALMIAARYGHSLAVEALLVGGADIGQVNPQVRMREWAVRSVGGCVVGWSWRGGFLRGSSELTHGGAWPSAPSRAWMGLV